AAGGHGAAMMDGERLADVPADVLRVHVAGRVDGLAWWDVAGRPERVPPPHAGAGRAVLDLRAGPEPLAALPALLSAGWAVGRRGDGGIPLAVLDLLDRFVPVAGAGSPELVVAGAVPTRAGVDPVGLLLEPG